MTLEELNPHSRRFAERLLERHPEWRSLLGLPTWERAAPGSLLVEVPAPFPEGDPLSVDTDNEEVTVAFGFWHDHFGSWTGEPEEEEIERALDTIDDILAERLVVVGAFDQEQWRRVWRVFPGETIETHHGERTLVRSWLGTYSEDLTAK